MVPSDGRRTNFCVDDILCVNGRVVTPLLQTANMVVTKSIRLLNSAATLNVDTLNATNVNSTNSTSTNSTTTNLTTTNQTVDGSIMFPTMGGIATPLNYYEEYSQNVDFKGNGAGPFAGTQTVVATIVRIGKLVTMNLAGFVTAGNGSAGFLTSASTPLPTRFRPTANQVYIIRVFDGSIWAAGELIFQSGGFFDIYRSIAGDFTEIQFSGIGDVGFDKFSISWCVA